MPSDTTARFPVPAPRTERGAALIVLLLILVIGAAALFSGRLAERNVTARRVQAQSELLAAAREALLGYALTHYDQNPGEYAFLPCPDIDTTGPVAEGEAHRTSCGGQYVSVAGRLPWKTLGLQPATHTGAECLWYAVSGTHKDAATTAAEMLNADTNGLLQVFSADGTTALAGAVPAERAVAVVIAPGATLSGQSRTPLGSGVDLCSGNYAAANYLDADNGIDNASLSGLSDALDQFITRGNDIDVNDQIAFITRPDIERELRRRADLQTNLDALTRAAAECLADYAKKNPGGATDLRLPWPAPVGLVDYRVAGQYDDTGIGFLSGRVPDTVDDSNAQTGNTITNVITGCSSIDVPGWTPQMAILWKHWKDHLFVAVADAFKPDAPTPSACGTCLTVNAAGTYAGVVMFANGRLSTLAQLRDAPPSDIDTRNTIGNYLEGRNATNHPNLSGGADYQSASASAVFNDTLYCIDPAMSVLPC